MSSRSLRLSARARRDVASLLQYSLETWGEDAHQAYGAAIEDAFRSIQRFPRIGRRRDDLGSGIRVVAMNAHIILYRLDDSLIHIERVVHHRMDRDALW